MKAFKQRLFTACLLAAAVGGASYAGSTQEAKRQKVDAVTCATPPAIPTKKEGSTKTKKTTKTTKKKQGKKQKKAESRPDTATVQHACSRG